MPELPEVETMVRGLRPALGRPAAAGSRFWIRPWCEGVRRTT